MVRCGIAIYGMDPFQRDPADHGLEPALELVSYVAEVKRCAAGRERGLRAALRRRARDLARDGPDRLRRRRAARADQQRRRARRRPPRAAGRHGLDGQHHRRPRRCAGATRGAEAVLIGARGGERILAEELARRAGHDQLRDHLRPQRRACRGSTRDRPAAPRRARRWPAQRAWLVGGAVRDRLLGRADRRPRHLAAAASRGAPRGDRPRDGRGGVPALRARSAPGASSGPATLARRPRAAARRRHRGRPRRARLHDQRDGRAAGRRRAARPARRPGRPRGAAACGWSPRARWPTTRCATLRAVRLATELDLTLDPATGRAVARARRGDRPRRPGARVRRAQAHRHRRAARAPAWS